MKTHVNVLFLGASLVFLSLIYLSCNQNSDRVPTVAVDEYLNLSLPEFSVLNAVNNWIYYDIAGNRGIIVIRTGATEFSAYERTCTFDPSVSTAVVQGIPNDIIAVDSTCGSQFSLIDGSVVKGPANQPLFRYRTELLQNNILHIFN